MLSTPCLSKIFHHFFFVCVTGLLTLLSASSLTISIVPSSVCTVLPGNLAEKNLVKTCFTSPPAAPDYVSHSAFHTVLQICTIDFLCLEPSKSTAPLYILQDSVTVTYHHFIRSHPLPEAPTAHGMPLSCHTLSPPFPWE